MRPLFTSALAPPSRDQRLLLRVAADGRGRARACTTGLRCKSVDRGEFVGARSPSSSPQPAAALAAGGVGQLTRSFLSLSLFSPFLIPVAHNQRFSGFLSARAPAGASPPRAKGCKMFWMWQSENFKANPFSAPSRPGEIAESPPALEVFLFECASWFPEYLSSLLFSV